ncbi:MAG: pre-16S rRNA-processing nuclease YqgF [Candidatus Eremiobacteraeota bacterium]|nr:pre-16S rRNA-processing nuclease YqgF [Candidatus Eremiobacteraeota bacterium]
MAEVFNEKVSEGPHTMKEAEEVILSLDPGKEKCGLAVVSETLLVKARRVVQTSAILDELEALIKKYGPRKILIGSGTFSKKLRSLIKGSAITLPLEVIDEKHSTEEARRKYFRENPPRGLWRLIPTTLQVPPKAYDDYAAIVLAEKYFGEVKRNENSA